MGQPAAKKGDRIVAVDVHVVLTPAPVLLPRPFSGSINGKLSPNMNIMGMPAATVGSTAVNTPPHVPTPPGFAFLIPPADKATITKGSRTVNINGNSAARRGDTATTCNDPEDLPVGKVIAGGTVFIG